MTSQPLPRQESPARLGSARLGSARLDSDTARMHTSRFQRQKIWTAGNTANSAVCEKEGLPGAGEHTVRDDGRPSGSRHRIPVTRQCFLKETPSTEGFPVCRNSAASSINTNGPFPPEHFRVKADGWIPLRDPHYIYYSFYTFILLTSYRNSQGEINGLQIKETR